MRFGERGPRNLFVLAWDQPREQLDDTYLVVVQRFADQAALALTNASVQRLYARLEASLLPSETVEHPRCDVIIRYRSGEQRLRLGGDFVGSLVTPPGDTLHFVIGDVSGHGPNAAALGATLRSTWKALVLARVPIPETMVVMDRVLLAERAEAGVFATILMGAVEFGENVATLTFANAGHPPPLLITDGVTSMDTPPAPPLGFGYSKSSGPWRFPLPERWSMFSYTDGLIDVRLGPGSDERYGEARLKERLGAWTDLRRDGEALDALMSEIESGSGGSFADDVAVVMVSTRE